MEVEEEEERGLLPTLPLLPWSKEPEKRGGEEEGEEEGDDGGELREEKEEIDSPSSLRARPESSNPDADEALASLFTNGDPGMYMGVDGGRETSEEDERSRGGG